MRLQRRCSNSRRPHAWRKLAEQRSIPPVCSASGRTLTVRFHGPPRGARSRPLDQTGFAASRPWARPCPTTTATHALERLESDHDDRGQPAGASSPFVAHRRTQPRAPAPNGRRPRAEVRRGENRPGQMAQASWKRLSEPAEPDCCPTGKGWFGLVGARSSTVMWSLAVCSRRAFLARTQVLMKEGRRWGSWTS
jgi:hypothetical protein